MDFDFLGERLNKNCWYSEANPSTAWREGFGWLLRFRTVFGATVVEIVATIVSIALNEPWWVSLALGIAAAITTWMIFIIRRLRVRQLWVGKAAHQFFHCLREDVNEIIRIAIDENDPDKALYKHRYRQFHCDAAERIAEYFRNATDDPSIGCCIRLAAEPDSYVTYGRSKRLNPNRAQLSQPIPADQGVARLLRIKNKLGVYFFRDIPQAVDVGAWLAMPSDSFTDIKTLMISPINGYIQGEKGMVGILYVTSAENPFMQMHLEPLMAFADALGFVYPFITGQWEHGS